MNRYAIKGVERRVRGMFTDSIYNHARFFSVWELKRMIYDLVGHVPITWRTVCQLPLPSGKFADSFEQPLLQRCPFGAFAGMSVTLVPRFRTRAAHGPLPAQPLARGGIGVEDTSYGLHVTSYA